MHILSFPIKIIFFTIVKKKNKDRKMYSVLISWLDSCFVYTGHGDWCF